MAEAIGSVRATFTASASGMTGAIDQIVGKLGSFAASAKRTQAQASEYDSILNKLVNDTAKGSTDFADFATKIERIQGKFKGLSEAERSAAAVRALNNAAMMGKASSADLAAAIERVTVAVQGATPPMERLFIELAKNKALFDEGGQSADEFSAKINEIVGSVNGVEPPAAKMDRVFKEAQETIKGLRTPADELADKLKKLDEQLQAGLIAPTQYAAAVRKAREEFAAADPAAQALASTLSRGAAITREFETVSESYARNVRELDELWQAGAISAETYTRAIAKQNATIAEAPARPTAPAEPEAPAEGGGALALVAKLPGPVGNVVGQLDQLKTKAASVANIFGGQVKNSLTAAFSGVGKAMTSLFSASSFSGIMSAITALGPALMSAFAAGAAALAPILATAAAIGAALYVAYNVGKGFINALTGGQDVIQPIVDGVMAVASFLADHIGRALQAIGGIIGNVVKWVADWTGLSSGLAAVTEVVKGAFILIGGWVEYIVKQLEYWAGIDSEKAAKESAANAEFKAQMDAQIKAEAEAADQAERRAKTIKEGLVGPAEKMRQQIEELNDLEQRGLLTAEERAAQEAKIRDEFAKQDPIAQSALKFAAEQKAAAEKQAAAVQDITRQMDEAVKAGADLGAAADPIRDKFKATAEAIREQVANGLDPEVAKARMGEAVDAMNEELRRLGEDQKFAENIREGLKSEVQKVQDELDAIDKNQTLTAAEKDKAKQQVKDKFAGGLPGAGEQDAADKFREDQKKLKEALDAGIITKEQFRERQSTLKDELGASVSDLREKQEKNKQPDRRAVGAVDVNSSEGASTFFRLLRGQDDPTKKQLEEMRRQTALLRKVADAEAEVVRI